MLEVTQAMVDELVKPEHQYREVKDAPLDAVRMAWPFKTEKELMTLSKWFKKESKCMKKKQVENHIKEYGEAFL